MNPSDLGRSCDENCNECPIVGHPNNRLLTRLLNALHDRFGEGVYELVQGACPNLTVCYDCRIDDFCHVEGCTLIAGSLVDYLISLLGDIAMTEGCTDRIKAICDEGLKKCDLLI